MSLEIKPNTTTVLLFQGDDLDPLVDRATDVEQAVKTEAPARLNDDQPDKVVESTKAYDETLDEALERAVRVRMTALPRKAYRLLLNEHPPRMVDSPDGPQPHPEDQSLGFNRDTFGDAIVPACVDLGQFDHDAGKRDAFLDNLSDGWFSKLYSAAVSLNQSTGPNPKVRLSSHIDPTSDETSESPARLG